MDLNNPEMPENKKAGKKDKGPQILPTDIEVAVAGAAGELMAAQGAIDFLDHLTNLHLTMGDMSEEGQKKIDDLIITEDTPLTPLEQFLTSDHPSHLTKINSLNEYIEKSKRTVNVLDETDFSGKTLYDMMPDEIKRELDDQLHGLSDPKAVKEALEGELTGFAGEIWHDYKTNYRGAENEKIGQLSVLLYGPESEEKDAQGLKSVKKEVIGVTELGSLLETEKARLIVNVLTSTPKNKSEREVEAKKVMGKEYDIVMRQISHMEEVLTKDWIGSDPDKGIINPTSGTELFCPEIQVRMDSRGPSKRQEEILEKTYGIMARQKHSSEVSLREELHQKITFTIASLQVVEEGKKALLSNTFKELRDIASPQAKEKAAASAEKVKTDKEKDLPKGGKVRRWMRGIGDRASENLEKIGMKESVQNVIKQWPQLLAVGMMTQVKDLDGKHYGRSEEWVAFMKGEAGLTEIDHLG